VTETVRSDNSGAENLSENVHPESPNQLKTRTHRIFSAVLSFFIGQGAVQGINLIIGLFLLRALSVGDYAKFGLASGFQVTTSIRMDLGYASTIIPLVGDRLF
jgi:hypothetical protein